MAGLEQSGKWAEQKEQFHSFAEELVRHHMIAELQVRLRIPAEPGVVQLRKILVVWLHKLTGLLG
jgi:hypothetical protein